MITYIRSFASAVIYLLAMVTPQVSAVPMGADLVVVIDQSGSMSGQGASRGLHPSDPNGMRVSFMHNIVPKLLEGAAKGYTNTLSVIEFGGRNALDPAFRPQITLSGITIQPVYTTRSTDMVKQELLAALQVVKPANRGDTDHAAALELADQELKTLQAHPPAASPGSHIGKRSSIVVLFTDGKPYAAGVSPKAQFSAVRQEIAALPKSTAFIVFGLDDGSRYWHVRDPSIGTTWGDFWRGLATPDPKDGIGQAYASDRPEMLVQDLNEVLLPLLPPGDEPVTTEDYTWLPPYLKAVVFTITYDIPHVPDAAIDIRDVDNNRVPIPDTAQRWANGMSIRLYHPSPGKWRLHPASAPYSVASSYEYEDAILKTPANVTSLHVSDPIRYRLAGQGSGGVFSPQPGFPLLNATVKVVDPAGHNTQFDLQPDPAHPGEFVSAQTLILDAIGVYQLEFTGTVVMPGTTSGNSIVYAHSDTVQVTTATPIRLRIDTPIVGQVIDVWFGTGTIPIQATFINALNATVLTPTQVLASGHNLTLKPLLVDTPEQPATPLLIRGTTMTATLPLALGAGRWRSLLHPGTVTLYLAADSPTPFVPEVIFQGIVGGGEWVTAAYPLHESPIVLTLGLALLLMIALGLYQLGRLLILPQFIARQDQQERRIPTLQLKFPTSAACNQEWIIAGRYILRPQNRRIPLPDNDTDWLIEDFSIRRQMSASGVVDAVVTYRPKRPKPTSAATHGKQGRWDLVRATLRATHEDGAMQARHKIQGLGDLEAYFVLLAGRQIN